MLLLVMLAMLPTVMLESHNLDYVHNVHQKHVSIFLQGVKTLIMLLSLLLWLFHHHHGYKVLQLWSFCILCLLLTLSKCLFCLLLCHIIRSVLVNLDWVCCLYTSLSSSSSSSSSPSCCAFNTWVTLLLVWHWHHHGHPNFNGKIICSFSYSIHPVILK